MIQLLASLRAVAPPRALTPLLLAVLMAALAAGSAQAATRPSAGSTWSTRAIAAEAEEAAEEVESEEEEEEEEEEIEVELEFEEGEESAEPISLPPECLLRTVEPHVVVSFSHDDLRLSLRYASDSAVQASVAYWLKGAKGTARLGSTTRRFGRRGVLEMSRHLDDGTLAKLRAARVIVVRLDIPSAPRFCKRYLTMRLTARRVLGRSATWYKPA
jgi:hypothetical protein